MSTTKSIPCQGGKIVKSWGRDDSSFKMASADRKMGGSKDNLSHSIKGASAQMRGTSGRE